MSELKATQFLPKTLSCDSEMIAVILTEVKEIKNEVSLLSGIVEGLSRGLANLTTPSQLKTADESGSKFPKIGKPETWNDATTKQGDIYYWTSDPDTVKIIHDLGSQAPQGYKIYPDRPGSANYFPPQRKL